MTVGTLTGKHRPPEGRRTGPLDLRGRRAVLYARSTTIHTDPQRTDDAVRFVRDEWMPAVLALDGAVGLSMLCDRGSGTCIVTSSWESDPAMRVTAEAGRDMVRRAAEAVGARKTTVDEWEIAVMHRAAMAGDGSQARVSWMRCDPALLPKVLDNLPLTMLPRVDATEGFCSMSLFVDRGTGRCSVTAVYEDLTSLEASRVQIKGIRDTMADHMAMDLTEIVEFELPIHRLRVPEQL